MVRRTSHVPAPHDFTAQAFRIESERLAHKHGLDAGRVRRILQRIAAGDPDWPVRAGTLGADHLFASTVLQPSLDEALRYLPPEDVLALFEQEDLRRLADREQVTYYLQFGDVDFYTRDERADLADACADHLEENRPQLISMGLPSTCFGVCWPGHWLRVLYPVKTPASSDVTCYLDGREIPLTYPLLYRRDPRTSVVRLRSYTWDRPVGPTCTADQEPGSIASETLWDDAEWVPCTYHEAPLTDGFNAADAARLEAGRPVMVDLEIRILRRLAVALQERDASGLWPSCLHLLTEAILADDAAFYLRIDRFLNGYDVRTGEMIGEVEPGFAPGGLTDLLQVIGDCEKELTIGTMDPTKRAMPPAIASDPLKSYYQAVGQPWRAELDAALEFFLELAEMEPSYWEAYRDRVNAAFENEFYAEVVVRTRVKQKLVATFEPQVRTFAEWQKAQLEATGTLPMLQLSSPPVTPSVQRTIFRREGETWTLEYGGQTTHLKDRKGLRYLAHLLGRPGEQVHVLDLVRAIEGGPMTGSAIGRATEGERAEESLTAGLGDAGPRLDDEAKAQYGHRLRELKVRRELAEELGNEDEVDEIALEVEAIERELRAGFDVRGRPRREASAAERARTNVQKLIEDARKQIAAQHPSLAQHLRYVRTGIYCSYDTGPDQPRWELGSPI